MKTIIIDSIKATETFLKDMEEIANVKKEIGVMLDCGDDIEEITKLATSEIEEDKIKSDYKIEQLAKKKLELPKKEQEKVQSRDEA